MRIQSIALQYGAAFIKKYASKLKSCHRKALVALINCRSAFGPLIKTQCDECDHLQFIPHSCGNRHCPHCQQHEGQRWIEQQMAKKVPADYFLITFTVPKQLRTLFWFNQKLLYDSLFSCVWETLSTFAKNDKQLGGIAGATMVLHTHSRALDPHPHIHVIMPAATINPKNRRWRKKSKFLFDHKALAIVFRAKLLEKIVDLGFYIPETTPKKWVVDCKSVGNGNKALVYLGKYLYRGVIQEKDILSCENGQVTFQYTTNSGERKTKILPAEDFLWRVLQHTLPKGFRRARDFGFLHSNSKTLHNIIAQVLKIVFFTPFIEKPRPSIKCPCCGGNLVILETRIKPLFELTRRRAERVPL